MSAPNGGGSHDRLSQLHTALDDCELWLKDYTGGIPYNIYGVVIEYDMVKRQRNALQDLIKLSETGSAASQYDENIVLCTINNLLWPFNTLNLLSESDPALGYDPNLERGYSTKMPLLPSNNLVNHVPISFEKYEDLRTGIKVFRQYFNEEFSRVSQNDFWNELYDNAVKLFLKTEQCLSELVNPDKEKTPYVYIKKDIIN